jgi:hypothetical protein
MHTPRFVRRKLRRSISRTSSEKDATLSFLTTGEDSIGETVIWRRFMDQVSEMSFKADRKTLGDGHLHDLLGESKNTLTRLQIVLLATTPQCKSHTACCLHLLLCSIAPDTEFSLTSLAAVAGMRLCGRIVGES